MDSIELGRCCGLWVGFALILNQPLLRPAERVDGAVQVAGVNVFPERIAERLSKHPMVAECTVSLDTTLPEPRL